MIHHANTIFQLWIGISVPLTSLSELSEQLLIGGKHFIRHLFELLADFSTRFHLMNKGNDLPLLLARELADLLDDFIRAHTTKLLMFIGTIKLCHQTTSLETYAIFGVNCLACGVPPFDLSVSGW